MNSNELNDKLKQLKIEDFVWLVYLGIIFLSWYSNQLERDYFINHNLKSKEQYRRIMIFIFFVLCIAYFYFLSDSKKSFDQLKPWDSTETKRLHFLSYLASILIFISGIILLYIAIEDESLNVEIAFN